VTIACRCVFAICCVLVLAGCQSFGRGVTRAIIEETKDDPDKHEALCEINGPGFPGLGEGLIGAAPESPKTARLIIVHGIGEHQPGYSERFQRSLALRLGLDAVDPRTKTIVLQGAVAVAGNGPDSLGTLRLARYTNGAGKDLLTFEVTWSAITEPERRSMDFDDVGATARTRAALNATLKQFMNKRVADPLAYRGPKGEAIREAVVQTICWATAGPWTGYPDLTEARCGWPATGPKIVAEDTFALSSHSLGSRISMDALEALGAAGDLGGAPSNPTLAAFRDKAMNFYMLSNQLPLLQIGRAPPDVIQRGSQFCGPAAPKAGERWFKSVAVVAFSDPNDLLSYEIPADFAAANFDSRLCADTTNVTIKVAKEISLAVTTFASPEAAHTQYEDDARVLAMIVGGIGARDSAPPAGCGWLKFGPAADR
jgi:hypothetical protein